MRYRKNGKISDGSYIVTENGKHIVNPTHSMMISNGWEVCKKIKESEFNKKHKEIEFLKKQISLTDYKVTKIAEALSIGEELPYDAQELHKERQALRDRINELEKELKRKEVSSGEGE